MSVAVLAGWFILLFIGFVWPDAMALANRVALPVLAGSVLCLELFRRLARRAERRLG